MTATLSPVCQIPTQDFTFPSGMPEQDLKTTPPQNPYQSYNQELTNKMGQHRKPNQFKIHPEKLVNITVGLVSEMF